MKKALYIGGFDMPDGNAAAQRVLGVGKLMKECGYMTIFQGLSRNNVGKGIVDGFNFINLPYPKRIFEWFDYLFGGSIYIDYIKVQQPDLVILYNHPAYAIERITKYCHKKGIKVVADITEWYTPQGNIFFKLVKGYDTKRRMKFSHLKLDGLICISKFLFDYYKKFGIPVYCLPPVIDYKQSKWHQQREQESTIIKIVYAGSPGSSKDRLDLIIEAMNKCNVSDISFEVIGISESQFRSTWNVSGNYPFVNFLGRLSHEDTIRHLINSDFQIFLRPENQTNRAGFPTKFVESITTKTLPITNLSSNIGDYIKDGINGFVISSFESNELISKLTNILSLDKREINKLKKNIDNSMFDYRNHILNFSKFITQIS